MRASVRLVSVGLLALLFSVACMGDGAAQQPQRKGQNVPVKPLPTNPKTAPKPVEPKPADAKSAEAVELPLEVVQADVSTRTVAVTSSFTGTEIVVFGAIDNSRQPSPESGFYDVVVVIEGVSSRITARQKSRVGGIWLNTELAAFSSVPSYYAIASTRPLDELAAEPIRIGYEIGFDHVRMDPAGGLGVPAAELRPFREAVIRLKQKEGLYVAEPHGVVFIGKSLFRATVTLPANVQIGPFDTRVYLFRQERLLSQYNLKLSLEREGLERYLHDFAFNAPFFYGLATVALALAAGLFASTIFAKGSH